MDDYKFNKTENGTFFQSSQFKILMASILPSVAMRPILHPFEILKIRLQQSRTISNQLMTEQFRTLQKEEGWPALFRGINYVQFVSVTTSIMQFEVYQILRKVLHGSPISHKVEHADFLAGFGTGAITSLIVLPLDLVRTVLLSRTKDNTTTPVEIFRDLYKMGGLKKFYSGANASVWHVGTLYGLRFMLYNLFCRFAMRYENVQTRKELRSVQLFAAGILGSGLANFLAYPLEFVKRRIQLDRSRISDSKVETCKFSSNICYASLQCIAFTLKAEGIRGFYRGYLPNAVKSITSTAIQFSCYDMIYHFIEDSVK